MATKAERKALLFFGTVMALGAGVRVAHVFGSRSPADSGAKEALKAQIQAADSARHAKFAKKKGRRGPKPPKRPSPKVDIDVATEDEIEALRGIGPSLAHRIVVDRDSFGPFGSLEGLKRVRGVGSGVVAKLDTTVTFSLLPRPMNTVIRNRPERPRAPARHRSKGKSRDSIR